MMIELDDPNYTLRDVAESTSADLKTADNYVMHGHLVPVRVEGKPRFSARQTIRAEITARLASLFRIPPSTGTIVADGLLSGLPTGMLEEDAAAIGDQHWVAAAAHRSQVAITRDAQGNASIANSNNRDTIDIVVPVQLFARQVLARLAARVLA